MFCGKCGKNVEDNTKFCPSCGNPLGDSSNLSTTNNNIVKLVIRRPKKFFGCAVSYKLFLDQQLVASISNGEELTFDVTPGEHGLICDVWSGTDAQKIVIAPGTKRVVYEIKIKIGLIKNKFEFVEVEKE